MSGKIVVSCVLGVCVIAVVVQASRWIDAAGAAAGSEARLLDTAADARRFLRLASAAPRVALAPRPRQDLIARLHATLTDAGLPGGALAGVQPESATPASAAAGWPDGGQRAMRQTARATLRNLSLHDLGLLLDRWRQQDTYWTPIYLALTHNGSDDPRGAYDAEISLASIYVDDGATR